MGWVVGGRPGGARGRYRTTCSLGVEGWLELAATKDHNLEELG